MICLFIDLFWLTTYFDFKRGAESPESSSKAERLKPQFITQLSKRCSFYCTSYIKGRVVLSAFNFVTKSFIIRLVIDDVTVTKMWSYKRFVDN